MPDPLHELLDVDLFELWNFFLFLKLPLSLFDGVSTLVCVDMLAW